MFIHTLNLWNTRITGVTGSQLLFFQGQCDFWTAASTHVIDSVLMEDRRKGEDRF